MSDCQTITEVKPKNRCKWQDSNGISIGHEVKFLLNFNGHKHFKCEKSEIISSVITQRTNNFQFNDKCKNKERRSRNETKIQCIKLKMENQFIRLRNFRRMTIMYPFSVCFVFFFFSVGFICSSMSSGVRLALFCIFDRCTSNRVLSCLWKIVFDIYFFLLLLLTYVECVMLAHIHQKRFARPKFSFRSVRWTFGRVPACLQIMWMNVNFAHPSDEKAMRKWFYRKAKMAQKSN